MKLRDRGDRDHRGNRRGRATVRQLTGASLLIVGIAVASATLAIASSGGSNTMTARAEAQRLLGLLQLPPGTQASPGPPAGTGTELTFPPSVPSAPHLIDLDEFFTAPGTPASFMASLHRPSGATQGDSGADGPPAGQWTTFEFGPIPNVVALRELVINAVPLGKNRVAVRVDSQTAPLPTLPGNGNGPGSVRVVESGSWLGSVGFELRCDPTGGTVPDPARICAAIRSDPALLYSFPGPDHTCPFGPPAISLTGSWDHKRLRSSFSVCTGGQEQEAGDWAGLLPSLTAQAAVRTDRGIGLIRLGAREAAVLDLLRGDHRAPATCRACTRRFSAGYSSSTGSGPAHPIGWAITFSHGRVTQIENNVPMLTVKGAVAAEGFAGLRRALHGWSTLTCAHNRELVHSSKSGSTLIVYGAAFERLIITTAAPSCVAA
jgi:hypothetical protein